MNRIDMAFQKVQEKGEKALIPYLSAGDPSKEKTEELIFALEEAGADIIELGIPYSDPLADGPVIEAAGLRAIANGFHFADAITIIKNIRKKSNIPLVFMCYYNSIFGYGRERFIKEAAEAGLDGLIVPDLPIEEREELAPYLKNTGIYLIPLAAVTSKDRIPKIAAVAEGFIYCVSSLGVTGVRKAFHAGVMEFLKEVKAVSQVPVCVGFGIGQKSDVEQFKAVADGMIVGSALVAKAYETGCDPVQIKTFIKELKEGTR